MIVRACVSMRACMYACVHSFVCATCSVENAISRARCVQHATHGAERTVGVHQALHTNSLAVVAGRTLCILASTTKRTGHLLRPNATIPQGLSNYYCSTSAAFGLAVPPLAWCALAALPSAIAPFAFTAIGLLADLSAPLWLGVAASAACAQPR